MRQRELVRLIAKLGELRRLQRQQVIAERKAVDGQAASVEVAEERGEALGACPHLKGVRVVRNGRADGLQRLKFRGCGRTFNALAGTPLARLRTKGKWLGQAEAIRDGLTIREAAKRLGINAKTAFLWRHRFLALPKTVQARALTGIAEADETYFLTLVQGAAPGPGPQGAASSRQGRKARTLRRAGAGAGGPRPRWQNRPLHPPGR